MSPSHLTKLYQTEMELENGQKIPQVGFGTWPMKGDECFDAVCSAIKIGYRLVSKMFFSKIDRYFVYNF